jgi:hypothetical protein
VALTPLRPSILRQPDLPLDSDRILPALDHLRQRGIQRLSLSYFGSADLQKFDFSHSRELPPNQKTQGWIAISVRNFGLPADAIPWNAPSGTEYAIPVDLIGSVPGEKGPFSWLKAYTPAERVGKSSSTTSMIPLRPVPNNHRVPRPSRVFAGGRGIHHRPFDFRQTANLHTSTAR